MNLKKSHLKFLLLLCNLIVVSNPFSAQTIRAYFNQSVDHSISSITDASQSIHLEDTICSLINSTSSTLDIAVWDNGSDAIVAALNAAEIWGVQVRYITSSNSTNTALSNLSATIPVLERNAGLTSNVMHNKFIIADLTTVFMGSMNFGMGSILDDYNNVVILTDNVLALNYTTEFNEMWGSSGAQPNLSLSKFGPDKTDNTTHQFTVDGITVESYFSPTDLTTSHIIDAINSADFTLDIALFTFINNDLGDAVIAAKNRGVYVRCIIENSGYFGSEYNGLISAGISTFSHSGVPNDFHHKYCIIDAFQANSDPQVVTGSHNWTNSAEDEYDENTLIIHDLILAQQYTEEFFKRYTELGGLGIVQANEFSTIQLFPNPTNGQLYLKNQRQLSCKMEIFNLEGKRVQTIDLGGFETSVFLDLIPGMYYITLQTDSEMYQQALVIE